MQIRKPAQGLWRVTWICRFGYQAPQQFVNFDLNKIRAKTEKEAMRIAKRHVIKLAKQQSQLGKFPYNWNCYVEYLSGLRV